MLVELHIRYWLVALLAITSLYALAPADGQDLENERLIDKLNRLAEYRSLSEVNATRCLCVSPADDPGRPRTIEAAVRLADDDVEGCMLEWNERQPGDVDITVTLGVTPDGRGHSSIATRGPDSPFLRLCVAEAIERVKYPPGPEVLDLEVAVQWSAGLLDVSPQITARRPTKSTSVCERSRVIREWIVVGDVSASPRVSALP